MKSKQRYIKIIVIVIALSVVFLLTVGVDLIKEKDNIDLIVLDSNVLLKKQNKKWSVVKKEDEIKEYNWNYLHTFVDNEYLGKYYLYFNEKWYLFDEDKNATNYNGNLIAFSNPDYKMLKFVTNDIIDKSYLNKVLTDVNLEINQELTSSYYISFDIDSDTKEEQLYVVSNRFPIENLGVNKYFSFVFLVKNEKIIYLYKDLEKTTDGYDGCKPYVSNIIDIDSDNSYEIILNCSDYSTGQTISKLYKFKRNKFELIVSS